MNQKKTGIRCRRSVLIAAVILSVSLAMSAIVYAATGANVRVLFGGQEVRSVLIKSEDGTQSYRLEVEKDDDGIALNIKDDDGSKADAVTEAPAELEVVE